MIWAVVAASAVFWALRFFAEGPAAPASAVPVGMANESRGDLDRLLGGTAVAAAPMAQPQAPSRFRLLGVVAPRAGTPEGQGVAVIAVDDKPPRAYRVGARVEGDLMLRSVSRRAAALGTATGESPVNLQLPSRAEATARAGAPPSMPAGRDVRRAPRPRVDDVPPAEADAPAEEEPFEQAPEEPPESDGSMRPED